VAAITAPGDGPTRRLPFGPMAARPAGPSGTTGAGSSAGAGAGSSARAEAARQRRSDRRRRPLAGGAAVLAALCAATSGGLGLAHPRPTWGLGAAAGGASAVAIALAALAVASAAAAWAWRPRRRALRWDRGADGEEATARRLAALGGRRWAVLHDLGLPGARANVDHLVIGPTGLWVIDSKASAGAVRYRRGRLWVGQRPLDTGPVRWEAEVVSGVLGQPARPLVVLHGPGLRRRGRRCGGVRVVPAGSLVRHLRRYRHLCPVLSPARAHQLATLAEQRLGRHRGAGPRLAGAAAGPRARGPRRSAASR
jgi:membrane protein implicated in regulation of membrane protease activity